jgi:hypothetical protein
MRAISLAGLVYVAMCGVVLEARAQDSSPYMASPSAEASIILRCIDQTGQPVSEAAVSSALYPDGSFVNAIVNNGNTDSNGCFAMKGRTAGEYSFGLTKNGYYKTRMVRHLSREKAASVVSGRWQPYGMTNTVILKRIVNPVAMYAFDYMAGHALIPKVSEPLGFDLMAGDWVAPYGDGTVPDFDVTYLRDGEGREYSTLELVLSTHSPFAGFVKIKSDNYSAFKSPHHADTNAVYEREIRFSFKKQPYGKGGHRYVDGQMTADECIILRTRTRLDRDGRLAGAHYGKIYGPMYFGVARNAPGSVKMLHYLNPTENDTNLEYDPGRNLLHPHARNSPP